MRKFLLKQQHFQINLLIDYSEPIIHRISDISRLEIYIENLLEELQDPGLRKCDISFLKGCIADTEKTSHGIVQLSLNSRPKSDRAK